MLAVITLRVAVVTPLSQRYATPPDAVSVIAVTLQSSVVMLEGVVMVTEGGAVFWLIMVVLTIAQPSASVTVTEYVPDALIMAEPLLLWLVIPPPPERANV